MTIYECPHCSGIINTAYDEYSDVYGHWCGICGATFETEDMEKYAYKPQHDAIQLSSAMPWIETETYLPIGMRVICPHCERSFTEFNWRQHALCPDCDLGGLS
jgi:DNA-directed RNA polymerase subunit RPC12/RpoP